MTETPTPQPESPPPAQALTAKQKLRAWLELARISNLPTVWSNVLVGVAIGVFFKASPEFHGSDDSNSTTLLTPSIWSDAVWLAVAVSLFYIAGMFLNDIVDAKVDAVERPTRPIPSGRVSKKNAAVACLIMSIVGVTIVLARHAHAWPFLAALVGCIVIYDLIHKRSPIAVLLMGACRGAVYVLAAVAVTSIDLWRGTSLEVLLYAAGLITIYILCITWVARSEAKTPPERPWRTAILMLLLVLIPPHLVTPATLVFSPPVYVVSAVVLVWFGLAIWFTYSNPPKVIKAILFWLAGISLVDAMFLMGMGFDAFGVIAVGCFLLTAWGHRHILGT